MFFSLLRFIFYFIKICILSNLLIVASSCCQQQLYLLFYHQHKACQTSVYCIASELTVDS
nr:MAG TPA: hypothetical protein [Caudoviricetes sp.]